MINAEYIRNLNCNYARILLESNVDERRYQYCILCRGGIKYLLPCSLRYINDQTYLYYDISSTQNIKQLFADKHIRREWMKTFFWSMQRMRIELNRFLLDEKNIIWSPEHIFQDLEKDDFLYLYMPYCGQEGRNEEGFDKLLDFWIERIDYEDEGLVEFVYRAYEQYHNAGQEYLIKQIYEDFKRIENIPAVVTTAVEDSEGEQVDGKNVLASGQDRVIRAESEQKGREAVSRNGIRALWEGIRKKAEDKVDYREIMRQQMSGYVVCEEVTYHVGDEKKIDPEEYGKTIYIEEKQENIHGLYSEKKELVIPFSKYPFVIGKMEGEVDHVLADYSASRIHARFIEEEDGVYIEDLNSTNGTFKNGLRMQPYEKRKLVEGDLLRFGKSVFMYK